MNRHFIASAAVLLSVLLVVPKVQGQAAPSSPATPAFRLKPCGTLPGKRQMHGNAVVGTRLYVFGGGVDPNGWSNEVISAEIKPTAELGPWRVEEPLTDYRHYIGQSVEVVNNRIYIVAGAVAAGPTAPEKDVVRSQNVLWTSVQPDGMLTPWKKSEPFPGDSLSCIATCSNDTHLYLSGGLIKDAVSDSVLMADFAPDGAPTNWRQIAKLPLPLWFHGAAIMDKWLYVWGGLPQRTGAAVNAQVMAAQIKEDGSLGSWFQAGKMSSPVYSAAFCGFNDYLVSVAGRGDGKVPTDQISFCRLEKGRADKWQTLSSDVEGFVYLGLGLDRSRGFVFIVGGHRKDRPGKTGEERLIDAVQGFQLPQPTADVLQLQKTTQSATAPFEQLTTSTGSGQFRSLTDALAAAPKAAKPVLVLFHSPNVPACKRFWSDVAETPEFKQMSSDFIFAEVDISQRERDLMYKYGVFKVPAMVILEPAGTVRKTTTNLLNAGDLKAFLSGK